MFIRFDVIHERDGRTDRRTDAASQQRPRLCIALRGKNQTVIDCLQLSDFKTRDDEKLTSFPKLVHCIFILWANTQNLRG